jgi:hypothetical protein
MKARWGVQDTGGTGGALTGTADSRPGGLGDSDEGACAACRTHASGAAPTDSDR